MSVCKKENIFPDPYTLISLPQAALFWHKYGFDVIPLVPNKKI
jgi:hypothetical protein